MAKLRLPSRPKLTLVLLSLLAFGNVVRGSFHFDDYSIFAQSVPWTTRPLTWASFWLNEQVGGKDPLSWHAINLLLHVACVLVFFDCARFDCTRLDATRRAAGERAALIAAGLFAIHPIQTEGVAYVFARATLLMTLFCLLSWGAWLRGRKWTAVVLFGLAVAAKEECVFFPLFLVLIERGKSNLKPILAMPLISSVAGVNVLLATRSLHGSGAGFSAGVSTIDYAAAQGAILWRYLSQVAVPIGFSVDPDLHVPPIAGVAGWSAIFALLWLLRKRPETVWFGGGFVLLLASSSFFPAADLAADRRMYLPLISFSIGIALAIANLPRWAPALAGLLLIPISIGRTEVWRTERSLWSDAVEKAPAKVRPRIQLARALPPDDGLRLLEDIEKTHGDDPDIPAEMGRIYLQSGHPDSAIGAFGRAAALRPGSAQLWSNLGVAFAMAHQDRAAAVQFQHALQLDACLPDARKNLRLEPCPKR